MVDEHNEIIESPQDAAEESGLDNFFGSSAESVGNLGCR